VSVGEPAAEALRPALGNTSPMTSESPILAVAHRLERPTDVPPGWDHNPTSLRRRALLAALAFVGLVVASYLTLFQLGVFATAWIRSATRAPCSS
jgi:hypothetical protein